MRVLRSRLYEVEMERQHQLQASQRKSQVGTGDRSEKIRTYNFPQNRLTDHRIGLTNHNLAMVMEGQLQPTIDALIAHDIAEKMFADPSLAKASIYFRAYTNAALREAGLGDRYVAALDPWRKMLADGLTTWAEVDGDASRSDCHAWGASPNFEFLRTVAGIEPGAPGFATVRLTPHLGGLPSIRATMPHPRGVIHVELSAAGKQLKGTVDLPEGTPGTLVWEGHSHELHAGSNRIAY